MKAIVAISLRALSLCGRLIVPFHFCVAEGEEEEDEDGEEEDFDEEEDDEEDEEEVEGEEDDEEGSGEDEVKSETSLVELSLKRVDAPSHFFFFNV